MCDFELKPKGAFTNGTDFSSATTLAKPTGGANWLIIGTHTQDIVITLDGTAPTATKGYTIKAGEPPVRIKVNDDMTVKVIEAAATAVPSYQWSD